MLKKSALFLAVLAVTGSAAASVINVTTQADFSALGTISQNTNFDAYPDGFSYPGSPYTVGELTFVAAGENIIGGKDDSYNMPRNLLTDNFTAGTTVNIAGSHSLLGFNAANFLGNGTGIFDLVTNLGSYSFTYDLLQGASGLKFIGYQASAGEFFTSIRYSGSYAVGLTDIQLGETKNVPEPATAALLGLGLLGFALSRRKIAAKK